MNHIKQAIDIDSEYAKKYLELVSRPDSCRFTEDHHIVPVAYFVDVLGLDGVRRSGSPDMAKGNIVTLSKGRHLLAHYYLVRCAKPCIKSQMVNAFRMMYHEKGKWDDADVIARSQEIDQFYASLKGQKIPHKDGIEVVKRANLVSSREWKGGTLVGLEYKRRPNGKFVEIKDHDAGIQIHLNEYCGFIVDLFGPALPPDYSRIGFVVVYNPLTNDYDLCGDEHKGPNDWGSSVWGVQNCFRVIYSPHYHFPDGVRIVEGAGYSNRCCKGRHLTIASPSELNGTSPFHGLLKGFTSICERFIPLMDFNPGYDTEKYIKFLNAPEVQEAIAQTRDAEPLDLSWLLKKLPA